MKKTLSSVFKWGMLLFLSKLSLQIAANYLIVILLVLTGIQPNDWHEVYSMFLSGIVYQLFVYYSCYKASIDYLKNANDFIIKIPTYAISFGVLVVTSLSVISFSYILTKRVEFSYVELLPLLVSYFASKKAEINIKVKR